MRKGLRYILFEKDLLPWLHVPWLRVPRRPRASESWRVGFLHQLSACADAGIDLKQALEMCMKEGCPRETKKALEKVKAALEEGRYLSEALKEHASKIFPGPFYSILEIGEKSGRLVESLRIQDRGLNNIESLRRKVLGALMYPSIVLMINATIITFLLVNVVPTFNEIFSDLGATLPFPTRKVVALSNAIRFHIPAVLLIVGCIALALTCFLRLSRRINPLSELFFRIPFFGPTFYHSNLFYFSSLMSMLVGSGAPTDEALSLCDTDVVWPIFRRAIRKMRRDVSEGRPFSEALATRKIFSPTFVWLTSVGEQKGDLADSLKAVSEYEMNVIENRVEPLMKLFQPVSVILISIVIGFVIVAMAFPIMRMSYLLY